MQIKHNGELVEVHVKKKFEYDDVVFAVHRPYGQSTGWVVSEESTGLAVGMIGATMDKAIYFAKCQLDNAKESGLNIKEYVEKIRAQR